MVNLSKKAAAAVVCDYDIDSKLIFDIGAKIGDYIEQKIVTLTAEEGDITGFILEMSLYSAGHVTANVSSVYVGTNLLFLLGAEVNTGGVSSHSRRIVNNIQEELEIRGRPWSDGLQAVHTSWFYGFDVGSGNHTFKITFDFNGGVDQNYLKLWILYGSTVSLGYLKVNT